MTETLNKKENIMQKYKIYGYMFDCHKFIYNNRYITGLCCAVKINQGVSDKELEAVAIHISKTNGFTILLNSEAVNIMIQPHKIYALALSENQEEELIEINNNLLMQYSDYIIESINSSAESSWTIDEC